jgi:TolB-like protein
MSAIDPNSPDTPRPTVFLSYASEDRAAAQRLRDSLPSYGLEVWYDESDLVGGDAWDQKIRRQIRECTYFMPVISAHTEARHEGYFRREWRLAVERTLDMADDHVFLLPVVIDATGEAQARVPDKFRAVQWLRLPGGEPTPALEAFCRRLVCGEPVKPPAPRAAPAPGRRAAPERAAPGGAIAARAFPEFPREEPGQRVRFGFQVAGWSLQSAWVGFMRLPRWVRWLAYGWVFVVILSRGCSSSDHQGRDISAAQAKKLQQIASDYQGNWTGADTAKLIAQIARQIPADAAAAAGSATPLLAIPFNAPAGDAGARKLAGAVFAQVYGRLAMTHHGHVALVDEPLSVLDATVARAQGLAHGSKYVVYGAIAGAGGKQSLTVDIVRVADGSVSWSRSYPVTGADPAHIAAQVSAKATSLESD